MTPEARESALEVIAKDLRSCQFSRALWHAHRFYQEAPDDPLAKSFYGRLLATARREFDAGLNLCREAARQDQNPQLEVNLAWVLFLSGNYDSARASLRSALLQRPDFGEAHSLLFRLERRVRELNEQRDSKVSSRVTSSPEASAKQRSSGARSFAVLSFEGESKRSLVERIRGLVSERLASSR